MSNTNIYIEMDEFDKEMEEAMFTEDEYLCNKCFRRPEECKCKGERVFVTIDEPLIKTIQNLNDKGVKTRFCCSGHPDEKIFHNHYFDEAYISFVDEKPENLKIPEGFIYKERKHDALSKWLIRCRYNFKTVEDGIRKRKKLMDVLEKWSEEV